MVGTKRIGSGRGVAKGVRLALVAAMMGALGAIASASPAAALTVSPPQIVEPPSFVFEVACATPTTCYALVSVKGSTEGGGILPIINGVAGTPQTPFGQGYGFSQIVCPSASTCIAYGSYQEPGSRDNPIIPQMVVITNGVIGEPQPTPGGFGYFGMACSSPTTCVGLTVVQVDGTFRQAIVVIADGVPGSPQIVPEEVESLSEVACTTTACYAVGQTPPSPENPDIFGNPQPFGVVVPIVNGMLGEPEVAPGTTDLRELACAGASNCYAVAVSSDFFVFSPLVVPIVDGTPGTPQVVDLNGALPGIACLDATTCEAVGFQNTDTGSVGVIVPIVSGIPAAVNPVPGTNGLDHVACVAPNCVATGSVNLPAPDFTTGLVVAFTEQVDAPTTLTCTTRTNNAGTLIDVCTVSDADGIRNVQVRNTATGSPQGSLALGCSEPRTTSFKFRVPAGTKYRVIVNDCSSPSVRSTFVIRANGSVNQV